MSPDQPSIVPQAAQHGRPTQLQAPALGAAGQHADAVQRHVDDQGAGRQEGAAAQLREGRDLQIRLLHGARRRPGASLSTPRPSCLALALACALQRDIMHAMASNANNLTTCRYKRQNQAEPCWRLCATGDADRGDAVGRDRRSIPRTAGGVEGETIARPIKVRRQQLAWWSRPRLL